MDVPSWVTWLEMGLLLLISMGSAALVLFHRWATAKWWARWLQDGQTIAADRTEHPTTEQFEEEEPIPTVKVKGICQFQSTQ
jgi:hypothetical protein